MASKVVYYIESPYASDGWCGVGNSFDLVDMLTIPKEEIRSCKANNEKII